MTDPRAGLTKVPSPTQHLDGVAFEAWKSNDVKVSGSPHIKWVSTDGRIVIMRNDAGEAKTFYCIVDGEFIHSAAGGKNYKKFLSLRNAMKAGITMAKRARAR